jgi:hypothetical protein
MFLGLVYCSIFFYDHFNDQNYETDILSVKKLTQNVTITHQAPG